jgi:hypothetical protein
MTYCVVDWVRNYILRLTYFIRCLLFIKRIISHLAIYGGIIECIEDWIVEMTKAQSYIHVQGNPWYMSCICTYPIRPNMHPCTQGTGSTRRKWEYWVGHESEVEQVQSQRRDEGYLNI